MKREAGAGPMSRGRQSPGPYRESVPEPNVVSRESEARNGVAVGVIGAGRFSFGWGRNNGDGAACGHGGIRGRP